jgi:hypothetical protein
MGMNVPLFKLEPQWRDSTRQCYLITQGQLKTPCRRRLGLSFCTSEFQLSLMSALSCYLAQAQLDMASFNNKGNTKSTILWIAVQATWLVVQATCWHFSRSASPIDGDSSKAKKL